MTKNVMKKKDKPQMRPKNKATMGSIEQVQEQVFKHLGQWFNSTQKRKSQINLMTTEIKIYGDPGGQMAIIVKLKLYQIIIIRTIFYGMEMWTRTKTREINKVERIEGNFLKEIPGMRRSNLD